VCRGGGTGRRTGLKILGSARGVRVRFPPSAPMESTTYTASTPAAKTDPGMSDDAGTWSDGEARAGIRPASRSCQDVAFVVCKPEFPLRNLAGAAGVPFLERPVREPHTSSMKSSVVLVLSSFRKLLPRFTSENPAEKGRTAIGGHCVRARRLFRPIGPNKERSQTCRRRYARKDDAQQP
jgi:hypothetical protein